MHVGYSHIVTEYTLSDKSGEHVKLTEVDHDKDLRVWISKLYSSLHCSKAVASAVRVLSKIRRILVNLSTFQRNCLLFSTKHSIYNFTHAWYLAPHNFSRGKTKNLCMTWWITTYGKGFCHAKKLPRVAVTAIATFVILKAMPRAVTRDEETHYTHCFEAYFHCIIN